MFYAVEVLTSTFESSECAVSVCYMCMYIDAYDPRVDRRDIPESYVVRTCRNSSTCIVNPMKHIGSLESGWRCGLHDWSIPRTAALARRLTTVCSTSTAGDQGRLPF